MEQLRDNLRNLAVGTPMARQLLEAAQRLQYQSAEFRNELPQMAPEQRDLALATLGDAMVELERTITNYNNRTMAVGTPDPLTPTPRAMVRGATPGAATRGSPTPITAQDLMARLDQERDQLMALANGQPTAEDLAMSLDSLQTTVTDIRQQLSTLSERDQETLASNLSGAMEELVLALDTYLHQAGAVPAATSSPGPSMMPSPSPSPSPSPNPSPSPTTTS